MVEAFALRSSPELGRNLRSDVVFVPHLNVVRTEEELAPLCEILRAVMRDLAADGGQAAWLAPGRSYEVLTAVGACAERSNICVEITALTRETTQQRSGGARSYWRTMETDQAAVLVAAFPIAGEVIYLSLYFAQADDQTRHRAGKAITRLLPLIQPFLRSWASQVVGDAALRDMTAAVDGHGIGIILVDGAARVLFANAFATRLFDIGDGLRCQGQMILGTRPADTMKLSAAINHVVSTPARSASVTPILLHLERMTGHALLVRVIPTVQSEHGCRSAAAIIYVMDPDRDIRPLISPICNLYGMSPVENRLACELAMGASLAEAARAIRVRDATARSYLKQLFIKTGTHRQADLIRLLILGVSGPSAVPNASTPPFEGIQ